MGLDLGHFKPMLQESSDYFTVEELSAVLGYIQLQKHLIVERDFDEFGKENVIYFKFKVLRERGWN